MRALALVLMTLATHAPELYATSVGVLPDVCAGQIVRHADFPSRFVPPRHIDVWLPPGYSEKVRHAVLCMHDGQMLFDASTTWNQQEWRVDEVAAELIAEGRVPPFVVVGVPHAGVDRPSEYLPQEVHAALSDDLRARLKASRQQGQPPHLRPVDSDDYLRFLAEELEPFIDQHYWMAIGPEDTFVMGSSMGGTGTLGAHYPPSQALADAAMRRHAYAAPQWVTREFPGAEHSEAAWAARLAIPLSFLLAAPNAE